MPPGRIIAARRCALHGWSKKSCRTPSRACDRCTGSPVLLGTPFHPGRLVRASREGHSACWLIPPGAAARRRDAIEGDRERAGPMDIEVILKSKGRNVRTVESGATVAE